MGPFWNHLGPFGINFGPFGNNLGTFGFPWNLLHAYDDDMPTRKGPEKCSEGDASTRQMPEGGNYVEKRILLSAAYGSGLHLSNLCSK